MAHRVAIAMANAMQRCHVREMAHSTPLLSTTKAGSVGGVSVAKSQDQENSAEGSQIGLGR